MTSVTGDENRAARRGNRGGQTAEAKKRSETVGEVIMRSLRDQRVTPRKMEMTKLK
jgi:hypothetical protein